MLCCVVVYDLRNFGKSANVKNKQQQCILLFYDGYVHLFPLYYVYTVYTSFRTRLLPGLTVIDRCQVAAFAEAPWVERSTAFKVKMCQLQLSRVSIPQDGNDTFS